MPQSQSQLAPTPVPSHVPIPEPTLAPTHQPSHVRTTETAYVQTGGVFRAASKYVVPVVIDTVAGVVVSLRHINERSFKENNDLYGVIGNGLDTMLSMVNYWLLYNWSQQTGTHRPLRSSNIDHMLVVALIGVINAVLTMQAIKKDGNHRQDLSDQQAFKSARHAMVLREAITVAGFYTVLRLTEKEATTTNAYMVWALAVQGTMVATRLLASKGDNRSHFRHAQQFQVECDIELRAQVRASSTEDGIPEATAVPVHD